MNKIKVEKVKDNLLVSFDHDADLVDKIKSLTTRKYIADMKAWQIPQWEIKDLIELFGDDLNISNDVDVNYVVACMFDKTAVAVCNVDRRTTSNYNPKAEFYTNWAKWDAELINDFTENFVVFFLA